MPGCSSRKDYAEVEVFPASGEVFVSDKPAVGAFLMFHPVGSVGLTKGNKPFARVDANGRFVVTTYDTNDGAPAGEYLVTVIWPENPDARGPSPDRLKGRYETMDKSDLRVKIAPSENHLQRWDLK